MNPLTGLFVVAIIAITVTDAVAFYHIRQHPENITISFVILLIGITILPIAIRYFILIR